MTDEGRRLLIHSRRGWVTYVDGVRRPDAPRPTLAQRVRVRVVDAAADVMIVVLTRVAEWGDRHSRPE